MLIIFFWLGQCGWWTEIVRRVPWWHWSFKTIFFGKWSEDYRKKGTTSRQVYISIWCINKPQIGKMVSSDNHLCECHELTKCLKRSWITFHPLSERQAKTSPHSKNCVSNKIFDEKKVVTSLYNVCLTWSRFRVTRFFGEKHMIFFYLGWAVRINVIIIITCYSIF